MKGTVKVGSAPIGASDADCGFIFCSEGALSFEDVAFAGRGVSLSFRSGDRILRLKGDNDFSGVDISFDNGSNNCSNYVAAAGTATTLRARRMSNGGIHPFAIGENVSVVLSKDYLDKATYDLSLDGTLEAEAFNILGNHDPILLGSGTLNIGSVGMKVRGWIRIGVSNLVFTTECPFRAYQNGGQNYHLIILANDTMKISSTCDWYVPEKDTFAQLVYFVADGRNGTLCTRPKVTFDEPYDVVLSPSAYYWSGFTFPWDINWVGTGTLTVKTPTKGDIAVANGGVKISALPCEGETSTSGDGKWQIDETLTLTAGQKINGAFVTGGTLIAAGMAQPHDTAGSNNTTYSGDNVKAFGTNVLAVASGAVFDVRNYEPVWSSTGYNSGSGVLNVHGTFKPASHDCFYGCTLLNGSTIDLSNRTGALPMTAAFTTSGKKTLEFASGAAVNVLASPKNATKTANGKQLISWSAIPEGVTFVPVKGGQKLEPKDDSLYIRGAGITVTIR